MQLKRLIAFLIILSTNTAFAQKITYKGLPSLIWPKLYNITYQKDGEHDKPLFTKDVKQLSNQTIVLPGYMVPFENGMKGNHFILSSLPLNACFFLWGGRP